MADLQQSPSFIPKRNPVRQVRSVVTRQVYFFTVIAYALILAALFASAGVFFYERLVTRQLSQAVVKLEAAMASFNEADMQKMVALDGRFKAANSRVENNVSVRKLFALLETATARTVQILSLQITREDDERVVMTAEVETDSFDSVLFQRGTYETELKKFETSELTLDGVQIGTNALSNRGVVEITTPRTVVSLVAEFGISTGALLYDPEQATAGAPVAEPTNRLVPAPAEDTEDS